MKRSLADTRRVLRARLLPLDQPGELEALRHDLREAAVLIALFERAGEAHFFLIRRPATMRSHADQISLPGGGVEHGDASPWHTAMRETREELGIAPAALCPLGRLTTILVSASGYRVAPFVAWAPEPPAVRAAADEVAEVIEVPLAELMDETAVEETSWPFREQQWRVVFFRLQDHVVWGATARILAEFVERIEPDRDWAGRVPGTVVPSEGT